MDILSSKIDVFGDFYKENQAFHLSLLSEFKSKINEAMKGGGESSVKRHIERKKFLARERIEKILDVGSPFLELSTLAVLIATVICPLWLVELSQEN